MKKLWFVIAVLFLATGAGTLPADADAKRLGGGKSSGLQRNMPARTAPDAAPAKPAAPAQGQQAAPANPATTGAAATPPRRNWMGPLAGLAAGLGLAALLSHFGLGEAASSLLMMVLLAGVAVFAVMFLLRRFGGGARQPALAGAGGGLGGNGAAPWNAPRVEPQGPAAWPRQALDEPAPGPGAAGASAAAAAAPAGVTAAFVPAGFDSEGFARIAREIFIRMQAAHDAADLDDLRRFTTPEMFATLRTDLLDRGPAPNFTEVLKVQAQVLDVAQEGGRQLVSVRYSGQIVEEKGGAPTDFNEVWHLVRADDENRGWAIAGIEQMA